MTTTPSNPGSDAALDLGCLCPVMDNDHGLGAAGYSSTEEPAFWINADCPLHGTVKIEQPPSDFQGDPDLPNPMLEVLDHG